MKMARINEEILERKRDRTVDRGAETIKLVETDSNL